VSLVDVLQGVAQVLEAFYPDANVTPFEPAVPVVPAVFPLIPDGRYHMAFPYQGDAGAADLALVVRVLVAGGDQEFATEALLPYLDPMGDRSVRAAIESDPTLAGSCDDAQVTGWTNGGSRFEYSSTPLIGADINIDVRL
jgi:hypothetical protein